MTIAQKSQSHDDSFGQVLERERMYQFFNWGQAIQLVEARF